MTSGWKGLLWFSLMLTREALVHEVGQRDRVLARDFGAVTAWTFEGISFTGTPKPGSGVTPMTSTEGNSSCSAGFCAAFWRARSQAREPAEKRPDA